MILMLSGYAGTGKDTAADFLVSRYGFKKASFASYLKNYCSKEYELPVYYFEDRVLKEKPITIYNNLSPRDILIKEGKCKREINPDFFVQKLMFQLMPWDGNIVISDMRYVNEYEGLKDFFGDNNIVTLRLNRDVKVSDAPSEHYLDEFKFSYHLDNNNDFEELYRKLDKLMEKLHES